MTDEFAEMVALVGSHVIVTLDEHDDRAIARGKLLRISDIGEVVIQDDMGALHWCWPALKMKADDG